jgi:sporulation protein YlmC with PRC-barrel domain
MTVGPVHAVPRLADLGMTQLGPTTESLHVIGVTAYVSDGTELGEVTDVKIGDHGDVQEILIAMSAPLGFGAKTVAIPMERCITLRGAVIVEMPITEVVRLPDVDASR